MSQQFEKFQTLYVSAAKALPKAFREVAKQLPEGEFATETEFRNFMVEFGKTLPAILISHGVTAENMKPEVRELLQFLDQYSVDEEEFTCKQPLDLKDISFRDIAGLHDIKETMTLSFIEPLQYTHLFTPSKGVLMYGPPGTGKTMLVKAATAEIEGVAFFAPSAAELKGKYEGETEKAIRSVFKCAQKAVESGKYQWAILFFDEFDAIAGSGRETDPSQKRTVNTILMMMDGVEALKNVSVVAATNYPSSIDDAVLRRFDTRIFVDLPDEEAIEYLIRWELAKRYSNPIQEISEIREEIRREDGEFNDQATYLHNIEVYGGFTSPPQKGSSSRGDQYITPSYIRELVKRLGISPDGKKIIEELKTGKNVSDNDRRLDRPSVFGYSPSDISKLISSAIRRAASRAVKGKANAVTFVSETYYVYSYKGGEYEIRDLEAPEKPRAINFDIRQSDVETALAQFKPTIRNEVYLQLLKYSLGV